MQHKNNNNIYYKLVQTRLVVVTPVGYTVSVAYITVVHLSKLT